jgi:competence protein ComEC
MALGREAISLRLIAVGALVVLIFWPDALIGPSFQMSFLAVTIIVALGEAGWFRSLTAARDEIWLRKAIRSLLGLFIVGVAIEAALMPIAIFHFHEAGMLGAFANLIAIPLTTFIVMPLEALALFLDLCGLGAPVWWVVGETLSLLLGLAHMVGEHPWAVWALPFHSSAAFLLVAGGGLWLILWTTRVRFAGIPAIVTGLTMMLLSPMPDLLITGDGRHMAVRDAEGRLMQLRERAGNYVRDMMSAAAGLGRNSVEGGDEGAAEDSSRLARARNVRCNQDVCIIRMARPERDWTIVATRSQVRLPWRAFIDLCASADIVVSDRRLPSACAPRWLKLDRAHLRETGGAAIYLNTHEWIGVRNPADRHPWIRDKSLYEKQSQGAIRRRHFAPEN